MEHTRWTDSMRESKPWPPLPHGLTVFPFGCGGARCGPVNDDDRTGALSHPAVARAATPTTQLPGRPTMATVARLARRVNRSSAEQQQPILPGCLQRLIT